MTVSVFPPWPVFADDERKAVDRVLRSGKPNYWGGDEGLLFEQEFAQWCDVRYGLCVCNGTLALELSLRACGLLEGDEVIVTPRSFLASAAAVVAIGATPIFADVDISSGNLTSDSIKEVMSDRTRGIVVVHLGGWPADMHSIMELAKLHNLKVIEDCAQAHGASIHGKRVGSFGDAAAFSFCQDKIMSTGGEGGMVLTNDSSIFEAVWSYRDHGRDQAKSTSNDHPSGFRWLQKRFGTNARMTEMQAAIGRCQLRKVDAWLEQRRDNANALMKIFQSWEGMHVPMVPSKMQHAYYRLCLLADSEEDRNNLMSILNHQGIPATVGPCPEIYREEAFKSRGIVPPNRLPVASELEQRSLVLPTHPGVETVLHRILDINYTENPLA